MRALKASIGGELASMRVLAQAPTPSKSLHFRPAIVDGVRLSAPAYST
jgi:hypothetical protein